LGDNHCLRFPDRTRGYYLFLSSVSDSWLRLSGRRRRLDADDVLLTGDNASWGDLIAGLVEVVTGEFVIFVALHLRSDVLQLAVSVRGI
jgi:hypothetical protein